MQSIRQEFPFRIIQNTLSASSLLPANEVIEKVMVDLKRAERLLKASDPVIEFGPRNKIPKMV
ncbi:MAG: hypothetical protein V8S95_01575 [Odoribacter sp.]